MEDIEIRRLGSGDTDLLARVVARFEGEGAGSDHLPAVLADDANIVIVALSGRDPAGFLLAHRLRRIKDPSNKIFLYDIEVAEQFRRQGVGTGLVASLLKVAKEASARSVFVFTNREFKGAPDFYASTGGCLVGESEMLFEYEV